MYDVYIDESGRLADKNEQYVVIAAVVAPSNNRLAKIFHSLRRKLPRKGKRKKERLFSEIKFVLVGNKTKFFILNQLRKSEVFIYILVFDKRGFYLEDSPENYGILISQIINPVLRKYSIKRVVIDRHFDRASLRSELEGVIRTWSKNKFEVIQPESHREIRVNLADFVAGAFWYQMIGKSEQFAEIIKEKVVFLRKSRWYEIKKGSG
jgi:hypothetical protein